MDARLLALQPRGPSTTAGATADHGNSVKAAAKADLKQTRMVYWASRVGFVQHTLLSYWECAIESINICCPGIPSQFDISSQAQQAKAVG